MRCDLNLFGMKAYQRAAILTVLSLPFFCADPAFAAKAGHGRVSSAPGQSLQITLPLLELKAQDQQALQVKIASAEQWSKAGLTPPVALDSLSVTLKPGQVADSRDIVISSKLKPTRSPVDILLEVTTASGATQIQSSYLVLLPADLSDAGKTLSDASMRVSSGDTLFAIAQRHLVAGADMYQMMLAIFEANPKAFISGNMNLLRAGAVLNIPDAETIRAVEAVRARNTFQNHLTAFNQRRGANGSRSAPLVAGSAAQSGTVTPATPAPADTAKTDQLLLSAASAVDQRADAKVSAAKEIEELQSRIQALQQNVKQLKESLGDPEPPAADTSGSAASNVSTSMSNSAAKPVAAAAETAASHAALAGKDVVATQPAPEGLWERLNAILAKNILAALTAIIALSALVIAWVLRRAGARRDEDLEGFDAPLPPSAASQSAFDQKLQSISLDLGDDASSPKPANSPSPNPR